MKKGKWAHILAVATAAALLLAACGSDPRTASADAEDTPVTVSEAETANAAGEVVRIIHINDVHSYVEKSETAIGYPKIAAFFELKRQENPNTIVLDAGDTFAGTASAAFDNAASIPAILNTMGFDAMTAGNADYMLGSERLLELAGQLSYPMLSGNTPLADGSPFLEGSLRLELPNGIRVGIVSVTTPDSVRGFTDIYDYQNPVKVCQSLVDELRDDVDLLVAMVHLGDIENVEYTSDLLAREVTGIDVIVDGHSHTVLETGKVVNGVLIVQAGEYSKYIGEIEIVFKDGVITGSSAVLHGVEAFADAPEKADTADALAALLEKREEYFQQAIGSTEVELVGTRDIVRTQETNLGNLFADALRDAADTNFAVVVAGIVGGEISPGDITQGDILNMARVSQKVLIKEMTGADLIKLLNHSVGSYPEPSGGFLQVSGFNFTFDPSLGEERVTEVLVDGKPLDLESSYTVAMPSGISDEGNGTLLDTLAETPDILAAYIAANSPVSPSVEGRIIVIE